MKFLDVKTDYAFKKVFGSEESKDLLISFLNALLYQDGPRQISDLRIVEPYTVPQLRGMKDTYVDVKAVLDDGSQVIIEMQVLNHPGFEQRILYNAAKHYSAQLSKGEDYRLLNPIVALTIVDFEMFKEPEHSVAAKPVPYLSRFRLMEKQSLIEYSGDIELVFVELPKFEVTDVALTSPQEKWIYFIQNAGTLETIPNTLTRPDALSKAFDLVNEANLSAEELEIQGKRREFIWINRTALEKAAEDGLRRGMQQGIEQGIQRGIDQGVEQGAKAKALEIAKNLLDLADDATIAAKTGTTVSDIAALRREHLP